MEQIRVLHLVGTMKQRFGVTSMLMNLYRNIDRDKVQFDFLVYRDTEKDIINEINKLGGRVYFMEELSIKSIYKFSKWFKNFFKYCDYQYNIIHSHFNQIEFIVFPIAKKNGIKTCISHSHNTRYSDSKLKSIRNYIMCKPIKIFATDYFACSNDAGKFLFGQTKISNGEVKVIKNAIDATKFKFDETIRNQIRDELNIDDEILIGHVGSFKKQKNHSFLIDIFYEFTKLNNNTKLLLLGDGELKNDIMNKINQYGIEDRVIFGGVSKNVEKYYSALDAFVFPSIYEGFGIVNIEAQVSGIPILASNVIPDEARIVDCAKYMSINLGSKKWAAELLDLIHKVERKDRSNEIKEAGYDLKEESKNIVEIYRNIIR